MKNQYSSQQSSSLEIKDRPECPKKDQNKERKDKDFQDSASNHYIFIIIIVLGSLIFCVLLIIVMRKFFRKQNIRINSNLPVIEINIPKLDQISLPITNINKADLKTMSPSIHPINNSQFYFIENMRNQFGNSHNPSRIQTSIKPNDNILILDEKDSVPKILETKNDKKRKRWRPPIDKRRRLVQKTDIPKKDLINKENYLSPQLYTLSEEKYL